MEIHTLFCDIDDFCIEFEPLMNQHLIADGKIKRLRKHTLHLSEVMTLIVAFHQSGYRTFKHYYQKHVYVYLRWAFPQLVSYNRFVELMGEALLPLCAYLHTRKGSCSGISFIDSMPIAVCHNLKFPPIAFSMKRLNGVRTLSAGSTVSSSIWWSTIAERFWQ